jgi:hypothetical protein
MRLVYYRGLANEKILIKLHIWPSKYINYWPFLFGITGAIDKLVVLLDEREDEVSFESVANNIIEWNFFFW